MLLGGLLVCKVWYTMKFNNNKNNYHKDIELSCGCGNNCLLTYLRKDTVPTQLFKICDTNLMSKGLFYSTGKGTNVGSYLSKGIWGLYSIRLWNKKKIFSLWFQRTWQVFIDNCMMYVAVIDELPCYNKEDFINFINKSCLKKQSSFVHTCFNL